MVYDDQKAAPKPAPPPPTEVILDAKAFSAQLSGWFKNLTPAQLEKMTRLYENLVKFNAAINLVSPSSMPKAASIHFADCIHAFQLIRPALLPEKPVYDLGSGNGFPGLVFGILDSDLKLILVDRDLRKCEYLKTIISKLDLKNISVLTTEVESLPEKSIWNAVSRGFAPLSKAMMIVRKQMPSGARFFHLKGDGFANELAKVPTQLFSHWSPSLVGQYKLPDGGNQFSVVQTEKIGE